MDGKEKKKRVTIFTLSSRELLNCFKELDVLFAILEELFKNGSIMVNGNIMQYHNKEERDFRNNPGGCMK